MGKWDGKRQAARRASRRKGRLRRSQTAGFGRRPNRPAGRIRPSAQILVKGIGRLPGPAGCRGEAAWGKPVEGGRAKRDRAAAPGKSKVKWRACGLLELGSQQGAGRPKGASAPPKPAAKPPRPSAGRPALRAPRPRGDPAKTRGYFGSRPSRRQAASRLCCSCAR